MLIRIDLMNTHHERNHNYKEGKMIAAAIPIAGIIVAAGLLSALSLVGTIQQPSLAQQLNATGGTEDGTGNETSSSSTTTTDIATPTIGGAGQGGNATNTTNITGPGGALGENQSEIRMHLEEARAALQNNDTQGALMHLDLVLNASGMTTNSTVAGSNATTITGSSQEGILASIEDRSDNDRGENGAQDNNDDEDSSVADSNDNTGNEAAQDITSSTDANSRVTNTEEEVSECDAVNIGGTNPADDYGCPPDPDY